MGTLLVDQIKKQASSFLQKKYRTARLVLTDVTQAELLAEEATSIDPWGPDAKTMTIIAEASFDIDDYWRIVDILHKRLYSIDWKQWRQLYKSLVLLEFLLTHGPEEFAIEFQCDADIIQELGEFKHVDEKGFNWGINMQKKSEKVLQLLRGGVTLKEARLKALKLTKEIQGFGSSSTSPSSSLSSPFAESLGSSSFGSYSPRSTSTYNDYVDELKNHDPKTPTKETNVKYEKLIALPSSDNNEIIEESSHGWDSPPTQERGSLLDFEGEGGVKKNGLVSRICSKLAGNSPTKCHGDHTATFRSFSDAGRLMKKKLDRQFSIGY